MAKEEIKKNEMKKEEVKKIETKKPEINRNESKDRASAKNLSAAKKDALEKTDKVKKKFNDYIPSAIFAFFVGLLVLIFNGNFWIALFSLIVALVIARVFLYLRKEVEKTIRIEKMEEVFPDFIELMASNLRAGMTVDKALLLSSRKEFAPLDKEILSLGKDIVTGKEISKALREMADRIGSDKISKTIDLINSGMKAGGNLSVLLEETAVNMREKMFIEKKASSNVLMYVIFIFFASAVGAPTLFALSSVLVQVMNEMLSTLPVPDSATASQLPITFSQITVSPEFAMYFSVAFLIVSNILASLILGITNKGTEKAGLKFILPMIIIGLFIFFVIRTVMLSYFGNLF